MGKRIIQQARGKGSLTYQVRKRAHIYTICYPQKFKGSSIISDIIHSAAHSAPLMKISAENKFYYLPAFNGAVVGDSISIGDTNNIRDGSILPLKDIPIGAKIYNIERNPGDGGKFVRVAGSSATISKKVGSNAIIIMPNKNEIKLNERCRATIGVIAGEGRILKPFVTAGRKHYKMKARNKLWPRTSAVKMNAVDHPFGSGRGKRIKPKIIPRNAPAGRKVGHLRPKRTGRRK